MSALKVDWFFALEQVSSEAEKTLMERGRTP